MADSDKERIACDLEEALAIRVIEELPDVVGCYRFSHKLVQGGPLAKRLDMVLIIFFQGAGQTQPVVGAEKFHQFPALYAPSTERRIG